MANSPYNKDEVLNRLATHGAVCWDGAVYTDEDALTLAMELSNPSLFEPVPAPGTVNLTGMEAAFAPLFAQSAQTNDQVSLLQSQIQETQAAHIADLQKQLDAANGERAALAAKVAADAASNSAATAARIGPPDTQGATKPGSSRPAQGVTNAAASADGVVAAETKPVADNAPAGS